jgi:hypothetical protein
MDALKIIPEKTQNVRFRTQHIYHGGNQRDSDLATQALFYAIRRPSPKVIPPFAR